MARRVAVDTALSRDDGDDAQATIAGDTRRLNAHEKRVVVRLRRDDADDDSVPWITEIVCIFFNAQGDVMRIHRADDGKHRPPVGTGVGEDPITMCCFGSKDAVEKERVTLVLADLHPSIEVVGFMVTYATDHIARRPHLNAFNVTCDATAEVEDEQDAELRVSSSISREAALPHVFSYQYDRPTESPVNYVVLCKIYRDTDNRNDWIFHGIGARGEVRSSVNAALAEAMQVFLLDIIPEIEIAHRNALNTVASICAALSRTELLEIETYFRDDGVSREEFAKLLLLVLLKSRPDLQRLSRVTSLVTLLFEMFEQIDINGDGAVDWEEFTTFCVSLGLIAMKDQPTGGLDSTRYSYHQQLVGPSYRSFPYQLRCIQPLPELHLVAVIQNKFPTVLMYDTDMTFLYEFSHVNRLCGEDNVALAILDLDYIQLRNWLVVSSSDRSLTFWSVVNATTGAYVFAFKIGSRCPIPHLRWCGSALNRLFAVSSEGVQLWDVDAKRVAAKMNHHRERITACVEIEGDLPMMATCSFDCTIAVLHVPSLTMAFQLVGHVQGIQQMEYNQRCGLLLSSGFEHQAYCWSIRGQRLMTTLGGHQASVIGARFVSHPENTETVMAIVGDTRGHFRLWDISRCYGGHATDLAMALQSFDIVTPNQYKMHAFACVMPPQGSNKHGENHDLFDIISGSFHLYRFHAVTHSDDFAPPRHVTFNSVSNCFVGSVDGLITVWSGNAGSKLEEPIMIRNFDVCAIAFDLPRQRKLFVATSDGNIRLYNPITAMMLTKTEAHDGIISSLIYCARSSCIISTGYDRRISVAHSSAGKTEIDVLRSVENAHDTCITTAAYSSTLELIATGDDAGNVHVYDFQRLYLLFRCEGHTDEIRALHFHHSTPALFSGDATGVAFVWHVAVADTTYQIQPMLQLTFACSNFFVTEYRPSSVSGSRSSRPSTGMKQPPVILPSAVTSIVCTPDSKHATPAYIYVATANGAIWGWDFRALTNHARKFGAGKGFEYRFQGGASLPGTGSKYNALLRVSHKMSVLKLRGEDIAMTLASDKSFGKAVAQATRSDVLQSCEASCVWQAHSSLITQIHVLPYPGQIYSVSLDGTIKVWDALHTCLGTITTIADHKQSKEVDAKVSAGTTSTSTWKFSHHHHMADTSRDQQVRIGREMLQRVKRKLKKEQERRHGSSSHQQAENPEEPEIPVGKTDTPALTPVLAAAEKLLADQIAFSKESRRRGLQSGLFGTEEARILRELGQGPRKQHERQIKSRLAPLMLASPKQHEYKTNSISHPQGNEHELPVMRSMRHFASEVERRRVAETRTSAHQAPPDVSLSPFLQEELFTSSDVRAPKSTPKKRLPPKSLSPRSLSLKMDASVVVMENVSLPLLHRDRSQPAILHRLDEAAREANEEDSSAQASEASHRRLSSNASAPCLPTAHADTASTFATPPMVSSPSIVGSEGFEAEKEGARVNIERKIRIYENLGVARTSSTRIAGSNGSAKNDPSEKSSLSRQHRDPHRRRSQPLLSDRQKKDTDAGRGSSNARKRRSQGTVVSSSLKNLSNNPFGPYYTSKQVVEFSSILSRFDSDCSGDIDKSEWVRMMQSCRPIFGATDLEAAEQLFHSIDRNDSGKISLRELLPMVFSKATPDQLQEMRQSIQTHI